MGKIKKQKQKNITPKWCCFAIINESECFFFFICCFIVKPDGDQKPLSRTLLCIFINSQKKKKSYRMYLKNISLAMENGSLFYLVQ